MQNKAMVRSVFTHIAAGQIEPDQVHTIFNAAVGFGMVTKNEIIQAVGVQPHQLNRRLDTLKPADLRRVVSKLNLA